MTDAKSPVYGARFGRDRGTVGLLALAAVLIPGLLLPGTPLVAQLLGIPLFGGGLLMVAGSLTRKAALRVDEKGVLLGGTPLRHRATTAHAPWQDITAVVLWRHRVPNASVPYVGLARRERAAPLPGPGQGRRARAAMRILIPHIPVDVAMASRPVIGWRLDRACLTAAVAHFGASRCPTPAEEPGRPDAPARGRKPRNGRLAARARRRDYVRRGQRHTPNTPERRMPTPRSRA
ncbi:hypothetical protein [Streptomyces sp. NPDC002889]|uniref:hypothetical protein n=1 Tax=Streptomyces sp. NPDC002889 TaxID=3364669 RepID=UPI0036BFDEEE